MSRPKLYFAHPVNTYDTDLEKDMLSRLKRFFPEFYIENPNQLHHQEEYMEWKNNKPGKSGMDYFYEKVLAKCDAGTVGCPFLDGKLGAGVAGEMIYHLKKNKKIWIFKTPQLFKVRPINKGEKILLLGWKAFLEHEDSKELREGIGNNLILSINDTRKRTWIELYKTIRPFEKAHLV